MPSADLGFGSPMKAKAIASILLFFLLVISSCSTCHAVAAKGKVSVTVDATQRKGKVPDLFRAGVFTFSTIPAKYVQEKILSELRPGSIEIDLGKEILPHSRDLDDVVFQLSFLDDFLRKVQHSGGEIVLGFSKIPLWLSSNPKETRSAMNGDETPVASVSPPRDYHQWAKLVETVARHMKSRGIDARYKIGWEPDTKMWQGSEEEFFTLYKYAVLGIRRAAPDARIGGPGVSDLGPHWSNRRDAAPMLKNFVEYCGRTPLPEVGLKKLPLDFIAFHRFGASPLTTYGLFADFIRRWLKESGYSPETELVVGEWSDLPDPLSMDREGHYLASFIIANLNAMEKAGVQKQCFTSLVEQQTRRETSFGGGYGLFTKDFVTRASYNAFRGMSMLDGEMLLTSPQDPFLPVIAALDHRSDVTIVIANYLPSQRVLLRTFVDRLIERGHTASELAGSFKNAKTLEKALAGKIDITRMGLPRGLEEDILSIRSDLLRLIARIEPRAKNPTRMEIQVRGLARGKYIARQYLIDSRNGNAFAFKDKIDSHVTRKKREGAVGNGDPLARFSQLGFDERDTRMFKAFVNAKDRHVFRRNLSEQEGRKLVLMSRQVISEEEMRIAEIAREINGMPGVSLRLTEARPVSAESATVVLELEPGAVGIVVLHKEEAPRH